MTTYSVQGYYGPEHGWEDVCEEETHAEAQDRLREYDENEPQYRHRIQRRTDDNASAPWNHEAGQDITERSQP